MPPLTLLRQLEGFRLDLLFQPRLVTRLDVYSDGAPEADYAAGKPLNFTLTPPGGTAVNSQFKSDKAILGGMPHASIDVSDQSAGLGTWMIEVKAEDLANLPASLISEASGDKPRKLRTDAINDIVLLCEYVAS